MIDLSPDRVMVAPGTVVVAWRPVPFGETPGFQRAARARIGAALAEQGLAPSEPAVTLSRPPSALRPPPSGDRIALAPGAPSRVVDPAELHREASGATPMSR